MYAALLGEVDGVRLISETRLREVAAVAVSGIDEVFGMPAAWGLGYAIGLPGADFRDRPGVFGVGGAGGSYAFGDTVTGVACALTKNRLSADSATETRIIEIVTKAFG